MIDYFFLVINTFKIMFQIHTIKMNNLKKQHEIQKYITKFKIHIVMPKTT